jgi:hypothetical protein
MTEMIKAHHRWGPQIYPVSMVVVKNLQALIYFAKYRWHMAQMTTVTSRPLGCRCNGSN